MQQQLSGLGLGTFLLRLNNNQIVIRKSILLSILFNIDTRKVELNH